MSSKIEWSPFPPTSPSPSSASAAASPISPLPTSYHDGRVSHRNNYSSNTSSGSLYQYPTITNNPFLAPTKSSPTSAVLPRVNRIDIASNPPPSAAHSSLPYSYPSQQHSSSSSILNNINNHQQHQHHHPKSSFPSFLTRLTRFLPSSVHFPRLPPLTPLTFAVSLQILASLMLMYFLLIDDKLTIQTPQSVLEKQMKEKEAGGMNMERMTVSPLNIPAADAAAAAAAALATPITPPVALPSMQESRATLYHPRPHYAGAPTAYHSYSRCSPASSSSQQQQQRCASTSSLIVGIGTHSSNHEKVRWLRDAWLRCVERWMIVSDTLDLDIPTTQCDFYGARHKKGGNDTTTTTMTSTDAIEQELYDAYLAHYRHAPKIAANKGTLLGRADGDQRFLQLPVLLNRTYNYRHASGDGKTSVERPVPTLPIQLTSSPSTQSTPAPPSFDWFLLVDDDTYIVLTELLSILSHFDPSLPYFLGNFKGKPELDDQSEKAQEKRQCYCETKLKEGKEQAVCWTREAKQRATIAGSSRGGIPTFSPSTPSNECEGAHLYGGNGLLLSRGLLDLIPESHWKWCLAQHRLTFGGDVKISQCIFHAGIGMTDITPAPAKFVGEKVDPSLAKYDNGIKWWTNHLQHRLKPNSFSELWKADPFEKLC